MSGRLLPEHVLPLTTAVCLVCGGWLYSLLLALLLAFIPPENPGANQGDECYLVGDLFHKVPRSLFEVSVIAIGCLIISIQTATYWKLWKQQQTPIGEVSASNNSRNKLYKRAMTTSSLIISAFSLVWLPLMIFALVVDWSKYIDQHEARQVIRSLGVLGIGQAFSNAIIFKLRNMKFAFCARIKQRFTN